MCPVPKDYTGLKYGKLTAIKFTGRYYVTSGNNKKRIWLWKCDCGKEKEIVSEKVIVGWVKSCGCLVGKYSGVDAIAYQVYGDSYADGDLTFEQFKTLSEKPCYYCGDWRPNYRKGRRNELITFSYHGLDRIDNSQAHNLNNVVPCCWPCNNLKSNSSLPHFLNHIIKINNNLRLHSFGIDGYII